MLRREERTYNTQLDLNAPVEGLDLLQALRCQGQALSKRVTYSERHWVAFEGFAAGLRKCLQLPVLLVEEPRKTDLVVQSSPKGHDISFNHVKRSVEIPVLTGLSPKRLVID